MTELPARVPPADKVTSVAGSPPSQGFRLGDRPALTGIRAVGITAVVVYHSNFQTLPGAWVMMGVFFVLSGFLITTLLLTEHQKSGGISLTRFYSRRGIRLLPPLFITVVALAVYALFVHVSFAVHYIWDDVAAAVFYFADYRAALGYEPAFGFLAQSWSLAVEEQFYLIWAILLLVILKYGSRKLAYAAVIFGIAVSTADRLWIVLGAHVWNTHVSARAYYAFDTRADGLFIGCLLALLATGGFLDDWKRGTKRVLAVAALACTIIMVWTIAVVPVNSRAVPLWLLPITEVASAVIIVFLILHPKSLSARALSIPVLVLVGNMSYAIYLFHWPVYAAINPFTVPWPFWLAETVRLAILLALALASWYLVERPLMRWRRRALATDRPPKTPGVPATGGPRGVVASFGSTAARVGSWVSGSRGEPAPGDAHVGGVTPGPEGATAPPQQDQELVTQPTGDADPMAGRRTR